MVYSTTGATISNTFGALQLGTNISVFLFGIVTLQVYLYFLRFKQDRLLFKALVSWIWLLELGHTAATFFEAYRTSIILSGLPQDAIRFPSMGVVYILGGLITTTVQIFFAYRLWKLLPKPYNIAGLVMAFAAFVRGILCMYGGINAILAPVFSDLAYEPSSQRLVLVLLVMSVIIDGTIAISMVYFLLKSRENALSKVTRLIDQLIVFSLRTGVLTSLVAISVLIVFRLQPFTFIYLAIYLSLGKLYSNTLLSSLNSRTELREKISASSVSVEVPHSSKSRLPYNNTISIQMKTVTEFKDDNMSV